MPNNRIVKLGISVFLTTIVGIFLIETGFASYGITEEGLLHCTNKYRSQYDLPGLVLNQELNGIAAAKLDDMEKYRYWAHTNPETKTEPWKFFDDFEYDYITAGENLAFDFQLSQDVCDSWMRSITHRENILDSEFQEIGFAIRHVQLDVGDGNLIVQMFGAKDDISKAEKNMTENEFVEFIESKEICYEKNISGLEIISPKCGIINENQPLINIKVPEPGTNIDLKINEQKFRGKVLSKGDKRIGEWAKDEYLKEGSNRISANITDEKDKIVISNVVLDLKPPVISEESLEITSRNVDGEQTFLIKAKFIDENLGQPYATYINNQKDFVTKEFRKNEDYFNVEIKFDSSSEQDHEVSIIVYDKANNITEKNIVLENKNSDFKNNKRSFTFKFNIVLIVLAILLAIVLIINLYHLYTYKIFDKLHFAAYIITTIGIEATIIWLLIKLYT